MKSNISKIAKKVMTMTLMCSLLLCSNAARVDASSAGSALKNYKGNVYAAFSNHDSYGAFTGKISLSGSASEKLTARVEAYYFVSSSDRRLRSNVRNYINTHSYTGNSVVAGGQSVTYPLCTTGYPCRAFATINGSYQGKAELYS